MERHEDRGKVWETYEKPPKSLTCETGVPEEQKKEWGRSNTSRDNSWKLSKSGKLYLKDSSGTIKPQAK